MSAMGQVRSLNEARKRKAGRADTGRCATCGQYRIVCRTGCLETAGDRLIEGLDAQYAKAIANQERRRRHERRDSLHG